jgi:viologen exporter family transport system permease protein
MNTLKLFLISCRLGVLNELEYRVNFYVHLFEAIMSFFTGIVVLWTVFGKTAALGGWSWTEILVVLGLWFITKGVVNVMIAPSIRLFMEDIWKGNLDYLLTKPVNHRFMATTRKFLIFFSVDIVVGVCLLAFALPRLAHWPSPAQALMVAMVVVSGAIIIYSFWIVLGVMAMWTVKLENIMLVFFSVLEAGRWPAGLYPFWLKYSMTFLVPIAVAITFPAEALLGRLDWQHALFAAAGGLASYLVARSFFDYGVRHKYTGASA